MQHSYPIYLKIDPETYHIGKHQLFQIHTCQFCGNDSHDNGFTYQKTLPTAVAAANTNWNKGIRWIQKCGHCRKTVSVVLAKKN